MTNTHILQQPGAGVARSTIEFPVALWERLRVISRERNIPLRHIVLAALEQWLEKNGENTHAER